MSRVSRAQEFDVPAEYTLPAQGLASVTADFDGDGDSDIATLTSDGSVATSLNDGHGAFTTTPSAAAVPVGSTQIRNGTRAVAGDFNNDGAVDLLFASSRAGGVYSGTGSCLLTLSLNRGDGSFEPGRSWSAVPGTPATPSTSPYVTYTCGTLDVGDFDRNGSLDFALPVTTGPESAPYYHTGVVNVFLGAADGTFTASTTPLLDGTSEALKSGDFDGDGALDLAVGVDLISTSGPYSHELEILSGDGSGQFAPTFIDTQSYAYLGATYFTAARATDSNGDGRLDLLLLASAYSHLFDPAYIHEFVATNAGDGTFLPPVRVVPESGVVGLESADVDADGKQDMALASSDDRITLALGDGHGGYTTSGVFAAGGGALASFSADFDGDGRADLGVLDPSRPVFRIALAEATEPGFRLPPVTDLGTAAGSAFTFTPGDVNGDGKPDLVTAADGKFSVLLGSGDGRLTTLTPSPLYTANAYLGAPLLADFNQDGRSDLAVPTRDGSIITLYGNADGSLSGPAAGTVGNASFYQGALGDFDEDGDLDLAVFGTLAAGSPPVVSASVRLYTNDGAGNFAFDQEFPVTI
ncbi:MAG TPA: VCBS repeat-containing protein, partial [Polyangiaceae bacterium]|nr:VCBS repeat-containing protein [Polyangiaceae bacterium]